jgi:type IV secretory pathway protease TraF
MHIKIMQQLGLPSVQNQCKFNTPYLIKKIVAGYKDKVVISPMGVYVNNHLIPNSAAIKKFRTINLAPLTSSIINLNKDEYFVLGQTKTSYDSRYFGVINKKQIIRKAVLLIKIDS